MRVFWIVLGVHIFFLLLLGIQKATVYEPPPKIQIHTVLLQKPKPMKEIAASQTVVPKVKNEIVAKPKVETEVAPKVKTEIVTKPKVENEVAPKDKTEIVAKPKVEKNATSKQVAKNVSAKNKLKQMLEESLASLDTGSKSTLSAPKEIGALQSESLNFVSYEMLLVEYLQQLLELPEQGQVKLELTLTREGKVTACEILDASLANRRYIEKEIASKRLPAFESHFKGESSHTFPIVLKTY